MRYFLVLFLMLIHINECSASEKIEFPKKKVSSIIVKRFVGDIVLKKSTKNIEVIFSKNARENVEVYLKNKILFLKSSSQENDFVNVSHGNITMVSFGSNTEQTINIGNKNYSNKNVNNKKTKVILKVPDNIDLDIISSGSIVSQANLSKINIEHSGTSDIKISNSNIKNIYISHTGSSDISLKKVQANNLEVALSGSNDLLAKGVFNNINIEASGVCDIVTNSDVVNYNIALTGVCNAEHKGKIKGRINKDIAMPSNFTIH